MQKTNPKYSRPRARLVPVARWTTPSITIAIDGETLQVPRGQSILASLLSHRSSLRTSLISGSPRAGFCLMGACQECWVWLGDGRRLRACTTPVADGMEICTAAPPGFPQP